MIPIPNWLVRAGRNAPMAKTMLVPESWSNQAKELPQKWRDMYSYCNSVMEPWDGPAALAMTDGRWVWAQKVEKKIFRIFEKKFCDAKRTLHIA